MGACYVIDGEPICEECINEMAIPNPNPVRLTAAIVKKSEEAFDFDNGALIGVRTYFDIPPGCVYCATLDEKVMDDLTKEA